MSAIHVDGATLVIEDAHPGIVSVRCDLFPEPVANLHGQASYTGEELWRMPLPSDWFTVPSHTLGTIHVSRDGIDHALAAAAREPDAVELSAAPPGEEVRGVVDYFDGRVARGWLRGGESDEPLDAVLLVDGTVIGAIPASQLRQDLRQAGHATARCGFVMQIPKQLVSPYGSVVCLRARQYAFVLKNGLIATDRRGLAGFALARLEMRLRRIETILEGDD